ncbi:MAG: alanine acetyltransferase [Candidatus Muproteobacteria bacterium RBG_16_60_9]|uniref:Alanine acetyltransferase n=1 Tax=Candidatus Muproteobacteria bacterium RBG_16_60_9 TaxID=1817755 RepID=A0A1F6VI64_9PROT|nr:MAG: alanine acetyltransferase [Candidatus Muproteobacteria bacterium RBG_16_60_9]
MELKGSCHCGGVKFTLTSAHPYPFNICYCSICRKTAGGGGFAINLGGDSESLVVAGKRNVTVYQVRCVDSETEAVTKSSARRSFCKICGSALWVWSPEWPELIHPFASAVDTPLPLPPERTHLMLGSKAPWVEVHTGARDQIFDEYPKESIAEWHQRLGLEEK